jgi:hypothetical protein
MSMNSRPSSARMCRTRAASRDVEQVIDGLADDHDVEAPTTEVMSLRPAR